MHPPRKSGEGGIEVSNKLLKRLVALAVMAERGTKYERINAQLLLDKLLKKHGMTYESIRRHVPKGQRQKAKPRPKSRPKPRPEPRPKSRPKPRPEPRPKSRPKPRPKPRPEPRPKPRPKQATMEEFLNEHAYLYLPMGAALSVVSFAIMYAWHYILTGEWLFIF